RHTRFSRDWSSDVCSSDLNKNLERKVAERTKELEISLKEQKKTEKRLSENNLALSQALAELHRTKEELINLNDELERRVDSRTKIGRASCRERVERWVESG